MAPVEKSKAVLEERIAQQNEKIVTNQRKISENNKNKKPWWMPKKPFDSTKKSNKALIEDGKRLEDDNKILYTARENLSADLEYCNGSIKQLKNDKAIKEREIEKASSEAERESVQMPSPPTIPESIKKAQSEEKQAEEELLKADEGGKLTSQKNLVSKKDETLNAWNTTEGKAYAEKLRDIQLRKIKDLESSMSKESSADAVDRMAEQQRRKATLQDWDHILQDEERQDAVATRIRELHFATQESPEH